jgi:hypothetical protein
MAIYIPLIRRAAAEFVTNWNSHEIRKQPDKPHILGGESPNFFFNHPPAGYRDYRLPLDQELLGRLRQSVEAWGK